MKVSWSLFYGPVYQGELIKIGAGVTFYLLNPPPPVSGDSPKWLENPESTTSIQNLPYLTKLLHQRLQIIMCFPHLQLNCLSLCMLTSMSTFTERFLCDFGIKSWFSSIAAWKLFGMLWVFIWLNCTTKHRCISLTMRDNADFC